LEGRPVEIPSDLDEFERRTLNQLNTRRQFAKMANEWLTDAEKDAVLGLYVLGADYDRIRGITGFGTEKVNRIINESGIERRGRGRRSQKASGARSEEGAVRHGGNLNDPDIRVSV
jgi:hypothetical protein